MGVVMIECNITNIPNAAFCADTAGKADESGTVTKLMQGSLHNISELANVDEEVMYDLCTCTPSIRGCYDDVEGNKLYPWMPYIKAADNEYCVEENSGSNKFHSLITIMMVAVFAVMFV